MIPNRFRIFYALVAIFLAASACSLPTAAQPTAIPPTSAPPTSAALPTQLESTSTPEPTIQFVPGTETPTPTQGITETATLEVGVFPTDTLTPTLEPVYADVMKETNCRTGPGGHYNLVATYQAGIKLEVIGRDLGGGFIYVQNPDKPEEQCYVLSNNVKITGDPSVLPQYTPLASPTAAPSFTGSFKKFDLCKGNVYAQFVIINNGSVPFRSAYIKVINLRTNESTEKVVDAFDLTTACIIAKNIAPLDPGVTGYLSSETFLRDPRGNKMRAIIQVCTEKAMKGTCVNTVIEIKP